MGIGSTTTVESITPNTEADTGLLNLRPRENPFYFALPYGEFTPAGKLKRRARDIPWFTDGVSPLLKNHWIEIVLRGRSCFAQWQDVGPCGENDFGFVFGNSAKPRNTFDARAGLDVSPAVWHYLGMDEIMLRLGVSLRRTTFLPGRGRRLSRPRAITVSRRSALNPSRLSRWRSRRIELPTPIVAVHGFRPPLCRRLRAFNQRHGATKRLLTILARKA